MVGAASRLGLVALLATACLGPLEAPPGAIVDPASCDQLGTAVGAVGPAERKLLGAAAPYPADGLLRARTDELAASLTSRREVAWAAVARLLAPAPFAIEPGAGAPATLPTWHTWYDGDEVRRLFDHLVRTRTAEQLRTRHPKPFYRTSAAAFEQAVQQLDAAIPALTRDQFVVGLIQIAILGAGRAVRRGRRGGGR